VAAHREYFGIERIIVCHIHHGIRDKAADADVVLVTQLCEHYQIPLELRYLNGKAMLAAGGFEEKARLERYRIFAEILHEKKLEVVFTAHHADDQAETLYMRLYRGTSLKGLQGILQKRADHIYRPFLEITKETLHEYAIIHQLQWHEDETNRDLSYTRNYTRHSRLPQLEKEIPGARAQLSHIALLTQHVFPRIIAQAETIFAPFTVPPRLWPFPARFSPYKHTLAMHFCALEKQLSHSGEGTSELFRLWLHEKGFMLPVSQRDGIPFFPFPSRLQTSRLLIEKSKKLVWFCTGKATEESDNLYLLPKFMDAPGEWRYRRDGDVFSPPGLHCSQRKLKKWFQENGIPAFVRDCLPLFTQGSEVLWIPGIAKSGNLQTDMNIDFLTGNKGFL
jgi:tRNA(Ile)-lysidine synthase